jgi:uncharacterized protein (TIGR02001 family)
MISVIVRVLAGCAALTMMAAAFGQAAAPEVNAYFTVATGYWDRGLSHNTAGAVLQAGAEYQHTSGLFAGGSVVDVDYATAEPVRRRELQVDAYVGYHRRNTVWSWTVALGRYVYPESDSGYDYNELAASVGFRDRLFFTTSYSSDFYSLRRPAWNSELALTVPLPANFEVSAALGRFDLDQPYATEYTHWNAGVSRVVRRVAIDARYYRSNNYAATPLGDPANEYVLSVSYAFRVSRRR